MSLFYKIKCIYPDITERDFKLQNDGSGDYIKEWYSTVYTKPNSKQLEDVSTAALKLYHVTRTRNLRAAAYPSMADQIGALMKMVDKSTASPELLALVEKVEAVKAEYPITEK